MIPLIQNSLIDVWYRVYLESFLGRYIWHEINSLSNCTWDNISVHHLSLTTVSNREQVFLGTCSVARPSWIGLFVISLSIFYQCEDFAFFLTSFFKVSLYPSLDQAHSVTASLDSTFSPWGDVTFPFILNMKNQSSHSVQVSHDQMFGISTPHIQRG